jgi:hypothetical protein
MKAIKLFLSALVLAGTMDVSIASTAGAADVISKDVSTEGSYCHMKFPAIEEKTLGSRRPALKDPGSGDVIDFYGPCNHDPLGKEEIQAQLLQLQHRRAHDYMN